MIDDEDHKMAFALCTPLSSVEKNRTHNNQEALSFIFLSKNFHKYWDIISFNTVTSQTSIGSVQLSQTIYRDLQSSYDAQVPDYE